MAAGWVKVIVDKNKMAAACRHEQGAAELDANGWVYVDSVAKDERQPKPPASLEVISSPPAPPACSAVEWLSMMQALGAEEQKKVRGLRKKLREIGVLEARLEEGAVLQRAQKEKLAQKIELLGNLRALVPCCEA